MTYVTRDKEAGNIIERFETEVEAYNAIKEYEKQDKADGVYQEDFYEVAEVGLTIKEIQQKHNMKLVDISRQLNIPYKSLERWSAGTSNPSEYVLQLIDEVLTSREEKDKNKEIVDKIRNILA